MKWPDQTTMTYPKGSKNLFRSSRFFAPLFSASRRGNINLTQRKLFARWVSTNRCYLIQAVAFFANSIRFFSTWFSSLIEMNFIKKCCRSSSLSDRFIVAKFRSFVSCYLLEMIIFQPKK